MILTQIYCKRQSFRYTQYLDHCLGYAEYDVKMTEVINLRLRLSLNCPDNIMSSA